MERSFQLAKCCYVGMSSLIVKAINNPMSPRSGCCMFQGRGGLPDHARCPTPCIPPFLTTARPPGSAGEDELVLKAPKSGQAPGHLLCLLTTASSEERCSQLGSGAGTRVSGEGPSKLGQTSLLGWEIPWSDWVCVSC